MSLLRLPEAGSASASADSDSGPLRGGVRRRRGRPGLPPVRTPAGASDADSSDADSSVKVSPRSSGCLEVARLCACNDKLGAGMRSNRLGWRMRC